MSKESCRTCRHYGFYRMITEGPYGYAGVIPCTTCSRFSVVLDNYESCSGDPKAQLEKPEPA
jgi:hypothetical protein